MGARRQAAQERLGIVRPHQRLAHQGGIGAVATGRGNAYEPRLKDNEARDGGQYGIALRWFVPELNDTEFGAYVMNYHSRNPYISFRQT